MQNTTSEPMDASKQFCPNLACSARGQIGEGTIRIHDRKRGRYRCSKCKQTFSARRGTMLEGLRKPKELIVLIVTLLAYGCPIQAIVHAFEGDERTIASWRDRAGKQCQQVHQALVPQGQLDVQQVQVDAHSGQRTADDRLDGAGLDGSNTLVVRRSGECASRSPLGRLFVAAGARLLSAVASSPGGQ